MARDHLMVGEWVVLIFQVPNYSSADARDGTLLPVVIGLKKYYPVGDVERDRSR